MTISLLLGEQIAAMLLMVLMGYAVVRLGLLRAEQSAPLAPWPCTSWAPA